MALHSATAVSDKEDENLRPIVIDAQKTSSNPLEPDFDTGGNLAEKEIRNLSRYNLAPPSIEQKREHLKVLKNWEGIVTSVENGSFFAAMRDTESESERAEDEFEIYIDNVDESDRELVQEGAVFYLTALIRYPKGEGPQKTTRIIFRRMPRWSPQDIGRAELAANNLWERLHPRPTEQKQEPSSKAQ